MKSTVLVVILSVIVVTVVGVGGWLLVLRDPPRRDTAEIAGVINELKSQVIHLADEQQQIARVVGASLATNRQDEGSPSEQPEAKSKAGDPTLADQSHRTPDLNQNQDPDMQQQKQNELTETNMRLWADRLTQEKPDPEWSPLASKKIADAYSRSGLSSMKYVARCGQTMCGVEFSLNTPNVSDAMNALTGTMPWDGQSFFQIDAQGKGVFYYAREGLELPRAEVASN